MSSETAASRIARARRDADMTQRQLADRIGTSIWTIDEIETGRRDPSAFAAQIERITGTPAGWLARVAPIEAPLRARPRETAVVQPLSSTARLDRNLVLGVFAIILTIRFLTESVGVLPSAGNFIDILLLPLLVVVVALRPSSERRGIGIGAGRYAAPALIFLAICVVSAALNVSRVAPAPALLFVYGFLGPLVFFYATYRLWPSGQALALSRTIAAVGVLQFATIALFDLPTFASSRNPDDIVGTFGGNAYQLVFFLLVFVALVAGISTFEPNRRLARYAPLLFGATFVVIFLAQYRALLVSSALTILLIGLMLGSVRGKGVLVAAVAAVSFVAGLGYVSAHYPSFKFVRTVEAVRDDPMSFITARFAPGSDVLSLYGDNPLFIATGSGPGTYSSRAWRTFAEVGAASSSEGAAQPYATALLGGRAYRSDVSERYVTPRIETAAVVLGSKAVTSPFSSYLALLAEVGVVGFLLLVGVYFRALLQVGRLALTSMRRATDSDPLPALALATTVAFFLLVQMAFLENWWEVARVTVPSWMMLAVCSKEFSARSRYRQDL